MRAPAEKLGTLDESIPENSFFSDELFSPGLGAIEIVETNDTEFVETTDTPGEDDDLPDGASETGNGTDETPPAEATNGNMHERVANLEKVIAHLARTLESSKEPTKSPTEQGARMENLPVAEKGWGATDGNNVMDRASSGSATAFRLDQIPPFPKDVPANKLWEAWQRFIENFELAVSLTSASDPVSRAKLLFLAMGPDLQGIVRAAKLRPNLDNSGCYTRFVSNVDTHLKSMTDTSSEHEAFIGMYQMKGESVVTFHSRLTEKVRLCGYSPDDQDRFVRTQLLKGMRNRELAKTARTFGYDTNYIVQSAIRNDAYETDNRPDDNHEQAAYAVAHRDNEERRYGKNVPKAQSRVGSMGTDQKSARYGQGRRSRCSRCNRLSHSGNPCPAVNKRCNSCGTVGHFAAACRKRRVNQVQESQNEKRKRLDSTDWNKDEIAQQVR